MSFKLRAYGQTDTGLVRQNNEDVYKSSPHLRLFALADGMGGHKAGEVAAEEAVSFIFDYLKKRINDLVDREHNIDQIMNLMKEAFQETNQAIFKLSKSHELLKGMGTTLCCIYFAENIAVYAHIGDSRIYRFRSGQLQQLTKDHSLLSEMLELGKIHADRSEEFVYRNILTKAIGTEEKVDAAVASIDVQENDVFVLCTDGLTDMLSHQEMSRILSQPLAVEEKVRALIGAAKRKGGFDNITVVLIQANEDCEPENIPR